MSSQKNDRQLVHIDRSILSDAVLVEAIQASDEAALHALYHRYFEMLYSFLWRKVEDENAALELLQLLFMRIWNNKKRLTPEKGIKTYLFTVANNLAVDWLRRKQRAQSGSTSPGSPIHTQDTDEFLQWKQHVEEAITALPWPIQSAFMVTRVEGQRLENIAIKLNAPIKIIESRMHKAFTLLREQLKHLLVD